MPASPAIPTVFVSHSHLDNAFGLRLIGDLRAQLSEAAVWYDVSGGLHGGDEWWREIVKQITDREVFMVILSPNALASDWVPREMAMAYHLHVKRGKRLLPIYYRPCDLTVDWEIIHGLSCRDPKADPAGYSQDLTAIIADILQQPSDLNIPKKTPEWLEREGFYNWAALPPPPPDDLRFPKRLADLGYTARPNGDDIIILPPLCDVPTGPFLMGSDKSHDPQARANELPQHTVTLAAYQIARYPVTVAEYACAVRVGAVREPPTGVYLPIAWQDQLKRLEHPVVRVSWSDALAYVRWLAKMTGELWRLPSEAEWEKAARGTDGRIYPWGDAWDKNRANTSDGGPSGTTSVGAYPGGVSPYGVQDMVGNAWEWTISLYKPYPYDANDGRESATSFGHRTLRGGSWADDPQYAHAAYRANDDGIDVYNPYGELYDDLLGQSGVRLAISPLI